MSAMSKCSLLAGLAACVASSLAAAGDHGTDWLSLDWTGPDWLSRPSRSPADVRVQAADEVLLVMQRERNDGAELLTLRVPLAEFGPVFAYAGAGLNRSVYFAQSGAGETFTTGHGSHRSLGPAAELGARWRVNARMAMSADLRWIDLASDASLLRSGQSLVAADAVSLGLSLGWRFR
jgi:hypothetical protein